MKVSHLVVNGCSCSKGVGLLSHEVSWPEILADKLNLPLVNIAVGGSGNPAIHRRNMEYFHLNLQHANNPLVLNVWSQYWREEVWRVDRLGYSPLSRMHKETRIFWPLEVKSVFKARADNLDPEEDYYDKAFFLNWDDKHHYIRTLTAKLSTIALLERHNYRYLNFDYFNDMELYQPLLAKLEPWYKSMTDQYFNNDQNIVGDLNSMVEHLPKASDRNHAGQEAQYVIANYIYDVIIKIYTMVQHDPKPFAKLQDYIGLKINY